MKYLKFFESVFYQKQQLESEIIEILEIIKFPVEINELIIRNELNNVMETLKTNTLIINKSITREK